MILEYREMAKSLGAEDGVHYQHVIFRYWVDGWTAGQLRLKENRAAVQIDRDITSGMQRTDVITLHGQTTATAISGNGSHKSKNQVHYEEIVIQAYERIVRQNESPIVSKNEIINELQRRVPRKLREDPPEHEIAEQRWRLYQKIHIFFRHNTHAGNMKHQPSKPSKQRSRTILEKDTSIVWFLGQRSGGTKPK